MEIVFWGPGSSSLLSALALHSLLPAAGRPVGAWEPILRIKMGGGELLSANEQLICQTANSTGLKFAMAVTASIFLLASACFLLCARTLKEDFVAQLGNES